LLEAMNSNQANNTTTITAETRAAIGFTEIIYSPTTLNRSLPSSAHVGKGTNQRTTRHATDAQ
jgi:hypothetical protein